MSLWMIALLVIVAFIIAILFIPITYSLKVSSRTPYEFDFRMEWLHRILKVHFAYRQGHAFFKEVYVLGRMKLGSARDYEDWLNRRVQEELDPLPVEEEQEEVQTAVPAEEAEPSAYPLSGYSGPEPVESVKFDAQGNAIDYEVTEEEKEKKSSEKQELPKYWWWKHVSNPKLYEALYRVSLSCGKHASPRQFQVEGRFGMPKPYEMGLITATVYSICPNHMEDVEFSYTEYAYTGSLQMKGYMQLGVFAWYGTKFILTKAVRELIADGIRAFLQYRRNKQSATV